MFVPGEEEEFVVQWGEVFADEVHGVFYHFVVDSCFAAFMCGFQKDEAFVAYGFLAAGADFFCALGEFFGDGAKF